MSNSTFSHNSRFPGTAIYAYGGRITITASIITRNPQGGADCDGKKHISDGGYNLVDDRGVDCGFTVPTDILNANPTLGPLANNGGPTHTIALLPTSPAIDVIPVSSGNCTTTDQRGVIRPDNGESSCDIGSYEKVDLAPVTLTYTGPTSITRYENATLSARLTDTTGAPIRGRVLRMQIGRGGYTQFCVTPNTDTSGLARCLIKNVVAWKSPNPVRVWFNGDKPGPNYEYAPGYNRTPVTIVG